MDRGRGHSGSRGHRGSGDSLQRLVQGETVPRATGPNRGRTDLQCHQGWEVRAGADRGVGRRGYHTGKVINNVFSIVEREVL